MVGTEWHFYTLSLGLFKQALIHSEMQSDHRHLFKGADCDIRLMDKPCNKCGEFVTHVRNRARVKENAINRCVECQTPHLIKKTVVQQGDCAVNWINIALVFKEVEKHRSDLQSRVLFYILHIVRMPQ